MSFTHRKHRIEQMEERQMMAADINLVGGDLQFQGTEQSDLVSVSEFTQTGSFYNYRTRQRIRYSIPMISAHISNSSESITENYRASDVDKISAWLGGGDDTFNNFSSETSYVWGENGDDTLRGGPGRDHFYGGNNNDTLYGRGGRDFLDGGSHNDGLFGGQGFDVMVGRGGVDRFLRDSQSYDYVVDARSWDATINFRPGSEINQGEVFGRAGRYIFEAGNWQDDEIELVDSALKVLHEKTGSDHLLERHDNTQMNFIRHGRVTDLFGNTVMAFARDENGRFTATREYVGGTNDDAGNITFTDDAFELGDDFVRQTTFHEIGHNFDERHENVRLGNLYLIDMFRQTSGWDFLSKDENVSSWQTVSRDGQWAHNSSATFIRDYASTNPLEDFGATFAAYFMGSDYRFSPADSDAGVIDGRELVPQKYAVLDFMFTMWGA